MHDDDLPSTEGDAGDKNQDKEEEDEGLFDVLYSNRSGTAEGRTTKGSWRRISESVN